MKGVEFNLHFTGEETETQKEEMIFPGSVSEQQNQHLNLNYRASIALKIAQGVSSF